MRLAGLLLLLAGWGIVYAAIGMLRSAALIGAFEAAGVGVEILGFILVVRSHLRPGRREA